MPGFLSFTCGNNEANLRGKYRLDITRPNLLTWDKNVVYFLFLNDIFIQLTRCSFKVSQLF